MKPRGWEEEEEEEVTAAPYCAVKHPAGPSGCPTACWRCPAAASPPHLPGPC